MADADFEIQYASLEVRQQEKHQVWNWSFDFSLLQCDLLRSLALLHKFTL